MYVEKVVSEDQREMKVSEAQAQCGRNCTVCCMWQPGVFYCDSGVGEEVVSGWWSRISQPR